MSLEKFILPDPRFRAATGPTDPAPITRGSLVMTSVAHDWTTGVMLVAAVNWKCKLCGVRIENHCTCPIEATSHSCAPDHTCATPFREPPAAPIEKKPALPLFQRKPPSYPLIQKGPDFDAWLARFKAGEPCTWTNTFLDSPFYRCYLCGHPFEVGDYVRGIVVEHAPLRWGNGWDRVAFLRCDHEGWISVCKSCDDGHVKMTWLARLRELKERFWWATREYGKSTMNAPDLRCCPKCGSPLMVEERPGHVYHWLFHCPRCQGEAFSLPQPM